MFGDRTSQEEPRTRPERRRSGRSLSPALVVALVTLGLLVLLRRRKPASTLEPPF